MKSGVKFIFLHSLIVFAFIWHALENETSFHSTPLSKSHSAPLFSLQVQSLDSGIPYSYFVLLIALCGLADCFLWVSQKEIDYCYDMKSTTKLNCEGKILWKWQLFFNYTSPLRFVTSFSVVLELVESIVV